MNIDITPHKNESPTQTLHRFTKAWREADLMRTVKGRRYHKRSASELTEKYNKLRRIKDAVTYKTQRRLGKIS